MLGDANNPFGLATSQSIDDQVTPTLEPNRDLTARRKQTIGDVLIQQAAHKELDYKLKTKIQNKMTRESRR